MSSKYVINVNSKEDFENNVLRKSKEILVMVDFWASWCGPCVMFSPIFEKVAESYGGKVIFVKVSVESNQDIAREYDVRSIPNVKLFKNGKVVDDILGLIPESSLKEVIKKHL